MKTSKITVQSIKDKLAEAGGTATCTEIAGRIFSRSRDSKYSEVDLQVRKIVYSHCPQHIDDFEGIPEFEAVDAWHYALWKVPVEYSEGYKQQLFRQNLLDSWERCMVKGSKLQTIASHAKPRRDCGDGQEKCNPFNGLLLSPDLDSLFDKGLICFDGEGKIVFSSKLPKDEIESLGLSQDLQLCVVRSGHRHFLEYHRKYIFKK